MRKMTFITGAVIAVSSVICPVRAYSDGYPAEKSFLSGDWAYSYYRGRTNQLCINGYFGTDTELIIPDNLNGINVYAVNFKELPDGVESVSIPSTVRSIDTDCLLEHKNLKKFIFPGSSVTGFVLFEGSSVEEAVLPSFSSPYYFYFSNCKELKKVDFSGKANELKIHDECFLGCEKLNEITFSGSFGSVNIGSNAFDGCAFESLDIPTDCSVGKSAFQNNSSLTDLTFEGYADVSGLSFRNCTKLRSVSFRNGGSIYNSAFDGCTAIENIDISDDTVFLPKAFNSCINLMNINSEPAFDSRTGDFNSRYKDYILQNFNGAQDVGFINEYVMANVKRVVSEITNEKMNDVQKVRAIHDWLCTTASYDYDAVDDDRNHTDSSVFMNSKAVCEGYSCIYDLLLREAGIESYYVHSSDHSWNIIKIGGHYFHSDTTWDDINSTYKWFLKSDSEMKNEGGSHGSWTLLTPSTLHVYDRTTAPACEYQSGDINTDGDLNVADLVGMSSFLHGRTSPDKNDAVLYDLDFDGSTDVIDMIQLRKKLTSPPIRQ